MFIWKYVDIDPIEVSKLVTLFKLHMPNNSYFIQHVNINLTEFIGLKLYKCALVQVPPNTTTLIHKDMRPGDDTNMLALNIPLDNCENVITNLYRSDIQPIQVVTNNKQLYWHYKAADCEKISEFIVTRPLIFNTSILHCVHNPTNKWRRAISLRFIKDPWHLV